MLNTSSTRTSPPPPPDQRHPAQWHLAANDHPAAVWGCSPAWRGADGLLARAASPAVQQQQQQSLSDPRKRQQGSQPQPTSSSTDDARAADRSWWPELPGWVPPPAATAVAAVQQQQQQQPAAELCLDLGSALRQQHPRLCPLPRICGSTTQLQAATRVAAEGMGASRGGVCIVFDVFTAPKAAFSRKSPGLPAFRVAMSSSSNSSSSGESEAESGRSFPSPECLLALAADSAPVPLRFAVLEGAEPCFFDVQRGAVLDMLAAAGGSL